MLVAYNPLVIEALTSVAWGEKAAKEAAFSFSTGKNLRTIAYIDGYNLYYGCLHGSPYKWLDVVTLCRNLVHAQNPASELVQVKFFTADVKSRLSRHGLQGQISQQSYHRALSGRYPSETLEVIKGYHITHRAKLPLYDKDKPVSIENKVAVWHTEEKQTDINIALHMVEDTIDRRCDQVMLFTSDSDLAPALAMVKRRAPTMHIGLVLPRREEEIRAPNRTLSAIASWTRDAIRNDELESAQLPNMVSTHKKPAIKPEYW